MLSSLFAGISGLISNSLAINVIGNNIANVNTVGYKGSRATFGDFFYQQVNTASGTGQVGRGSALSSIDTIFSQGSFETTNSATDLAIGGKGFFIVKVPGSEQTFYTRAGQFRIDKDGNLITPGGYIVQGQNAQGVVTDIKIQRQASEARATTEIGMYLNLNANDPWKGAISTPSAGSITEVMASQAKYPRLGTYSMQTSLRQAIHAGTNAYASARGSLVVSDGSSSATVNLSGQDLAAAVTLINNELTAQGVQVRADVDPATGNLRFQAATGTLGSFTPVTGIDIRVEDGGITSGTIGWTLADKTSSELYGAQMQMTGPVSETAPISVSTGVATNWANTGFDLQHGEINAGTVGSQSFTVTGFDKDNPNETSDWPSPITVYDSLGNPHTITVHFRKGYEYNTGGTIHSVWEWFAVAPAKDMASGQSAIGGQGVLEFDASGQLIAGGTPSAPITFDFAGANPGQNVEISFVGGPGNINTTQLPIPSTTNFQTQDGYPPGLLTNVGVNTEGVLTGYYSNGQKLDLYTIVLADFNNPMGLMKEGNNLYSSTQESGEAFINIPGTGGLGKISPNSLEQSNVDIATEFVKMIISQRGFQANSRVITTSDEILQELMNLKR